MIHGGSDGPVEEILPIEAMRAAMQRRDGSGLDDFCVGCDYQPLVGRYVGFMPKEISNEKVVFLCQSSALI